MALLLANAAVACALTGLIWTIQVVHYPLFAHVGEGEWRAYEREHQRRITFVVAPLMLVNVALAVAVVIAGDGAAALRWANLALAAGVFAATALVYSPLHGHLGETHDRTAIDHLVTLNWWRTAAWTAQAGVAIALIA
ncbi:MAG: hypothetical protein ABI950_13980 [Solirubrobacteraceae bacterium]